MTATFLITYFEAEYNSEHFKLQKSNFGHVYSLLIINYNFKNIQKFNCEEFFFVYAIQ